MAKERFRIIEFINPSGEKVFRVTGMKTDGERVRKNWAALSDAKQHRDELLAEANGEILSNVRLTSTRLANEQVAEAESAYALLPAGRSLLWAVKYAVDNFQEAVLPITVSAAYDLFIAERKRRNLRPDSIRNLEIRVGLLKREHGDKIVSTLTTEAVSNVIFAGKTTPVTRDNKRRALSAFFTWAIANKYCKENLAEKLGAIKHDREEPEVMSMADVKVLLQTAREYPKPLILKTKGSDKVKTIERAGNCLPAAALGLFAAVRPKELERITWSDIDLEAKTVTLGAKVAKMRERRIVEFSDNLVAILKTCEGTPIKVSRREFDAVKRAAGFNGREAKRVEVDGKMKTLKPWPVDILRHTAISMHLAKHQHEGKTAQWAGNSPDIIQKHYKGLVKSKDAEEFWQLT